MIAITLQLNTQKYKTIGLLSYTNFLPGLIHIFRCLKQSYFLGVSSTESASDWLIGVALCVGLHKSTDTITIVILKCLKLHS